MIFIDQFLSNSILILLLGLIIVYFRKHVLQSSKLNLPPGPRKVPIIGNLHQMIYGCLVSHPHHYMTDMAEKYGPVFQLQLGAISLVVVSTPESVKEVLKTHELNFAQRSQVFDDPVLPDISMKIVNSPYGDYWKQVRRVAVLKLLSARKVQSFRSVRMKEVSSLVECICSTHGTPFNLTKRLREYANSVVCKATLGHEVEPEESTRLIIQASKQTDMLIISYIIFPTLVKIARHVVGMNWKADRLRQQTEEMYDRIIEDHRRKRRGDQKRKNEIALDGSEEDLLDVLLGIQESDDNQFSLSDNSIKAMITDLFFGGVETLSTTLEWAMSEMLRQPQTMAKAQAEIREVLRGKESIDETDLEKLKYLKLVIKETLRLHPPAPIIPREARESCKISGYDIPKDTNIEINLWAVGRDPNYWKDPENFKPERFTESSVDFMGTSFEFLPFGSGRRMCPGIAFAMASIELPLANLLYHFEWKLPNGQSPRDLDMSEAFGSTVKRKNDLYLVTDKMIFM